VLTNINVSSSNFISLINITFSYLMTQSNVLISNSLSLTPRSLLEEFLEIETSEVSDDLLLALTFELWSLEPVAEIKGAT
jgi:hypothetical protein